MKKKVSNRSHWIAILLYSLGFRYGATTDIGDSLSLGYGKLDDYGFWQYQLYFD